MHERDERRARDVQCRHGLKYFQVVQCIIVLQVLARSIQPYLYLQVTFLQARSRDWDYLNVYA